MNTNQTPDSTKPSEREELIEFLVQAAKGHSGEHYLKHSFYKAAALLADSDTNAPWLTEAHMLCTDRGIPHGNITERIKALRDKLAVGKAGGEVVAYGFRDKNGVIMDCITPDEHDREPGKYNVPLYTRPQQASQVAQPLKVVASAAIPAGEIHAVDHQGKVVAKIVGIGKDQA